MKVLDELKEARVLDVGYWGDEWRIGEMCDEYFDLVMTKEKFYALAEELKQIADGIEE